MAIKLNKVLISDPVDEAAVEILRARNLQVDLRTGLPKDQLLAIIPEYDALIVRSGTQVTADVIQAAKNLKLIGRAGVGVDNIDLPAATKAGIIVINAPGGNTISAVELTCTMLLASSRYVAQACSSLKNGVWDRKSFTGNELKGKTLAIIGLGRIGREVAIRMQSFEMRTIGFDPIIPAEVTAQFGVQSLSLEEIWPQADYITVHTPLIPQTKDLINATTLAKCKKGVRIINVARGGIINEDDLLAALQSGHVAGAGLDVFLEEPPKNTPLVQHPKVVCTPHLGASTKEAQNNVAKEIALQFLDIIDSKAVPGVVNAPLLSEMLKHENLIWTRLGTDLGKLAAAGSPTLQSLKVTVTGKLATAAVKLIKESVLVGALTALGGASVNVVSAAGIAEGRGIASSYEVAPAAGPCCHHSTVTVETDKGGRYTAIAQGRRAYLTTVNGDTFEPAVVLDHTLTLLQTSASLAEVLAANGGDVVLAATRSKTNAQLYAIHSTGKLVGGTANASAVTSVQFN